MKPIRETQWRYLESLIWRLVLMSASWWVLTVGQGGVWFAGLLIPLVVTLSFGLVEPGIHPMRLPRLPYFIGYFAINSFTSGLRVASLILHPRLPIKPGYVHYSTQLPDGAPLWLFSVTLSLLPGAFCVSLERHYIVIHVLDREHPHKVTMHELEHQICALFGLRSSVKQ